MDIYNHREEDVYMCFVEGGNNPKVKHRRRSNAMDEAKRLATMHGNEKKTVFLMKLCVTVKAVTRPVEVTSYYDDSKGEI